MICLHISTSMHIRIIPEANYYNRLPQFLACGLRPLPKCEAIAQCLYIANDNMESLEAMMLS